MLIENETKVLQKTCKRRSLQGRAGLCHLVTSHYLPFGSQHLCNQFLMMGREKALEGISPSHPPFVLCPARLWSLRSLHIGLSGKPGVSWHGEELCKVPFLLCH